MTYDNAEHGGVSNHTNRTHMGVRSRFDIPRTRPGRPAVLDVAALNAWNQKQQRARDAYYGDPSLADIYALRVKASEKQMRYRRRSA